MKTTVEFPTDSLDKNSASRSQPLVSGLSDSRKRRVIERFTIDVNDSTLGRTITAFITVYPSLKHADEIINQVVNLDEVIESYNLSGRCGVFLKATFGDMKALNAFISKIEASPESLEYTCISLETIKRARVLA